MLGILQVVFLGLTTLLLAWYSFETWKLRREMVRQNQIALRPVVVPVFEMGPPENVFRLKNIGMAAAFNVRIERLIVRAQDRLEIRFDPLPFIESGEVKNPNYDTWAGEELVHDALWIHCFFPRYARDERRLRILFDDIEGGKYIHEFVVRPPAENLAAAEGTLELGVIRRS